MKFNDKFEKETCIDENYDPDGDKETGFYSIAYKDKYITWLESKSDEEAIALWREYFAALDEDNVAMFLFQNAKRINTLLG